VIRVAVVDDQTLVRQGIIGLLELVDDITVAGQAADGIEALELIPKIKPDVLLVDVRMPRLDGIGLLERLAALGCLPPALVLTTFEDGDAAIAAIRAGARGLMLKDVSLEDLAGAIRTLARDGTAYQPAMTESLLTALRRRGGGEHGRQFRSDPLSPREQEIMHLICAGFTNLEIASMLSLAEGTVKNYVSNLLLKLGARDRTRAALKAIEGGHLDRAKPHISAPPE
jgi:DNA-binding NarL/FixJ family response regulator